MRSVKRALRAIAGSLMIVGALSSLASSGVAAFAPDPAASTAKTLDSFWTMLDSGQSAASVLAGNVVLTMGDSGEQITGRAAVASTLDNLCNGAFAGRLTITQRIVADGIAATSGEFIGTQIGPFDGTEATGAPIAVPYEAFFTLVDNEITTLELDLPRAEMLRQLAAPAPLWSSSQTHPGTPY